MAGIFIFQKIRLLKMFAWKLFYLGAIDDFYMRVIDSRAKRRIFTYYILPLLYSAPFRI